LKKELDEDKALRVGSVGKIKEVFSFENPI
jgi:hypothetical protein